MERKIQKTYLLGCSFGVRRLDNPHEPFQRNVHNNGRIWRQTRHLTSTPSFVLCCTTRGGVPTRCDPCPGSKRGSVPLNRRILPKKIRRSLSFSPPWVNKQKIGTSGLLRSELQQASSRTPIPRQLIPFCTFLLRGNLSALPRLPLAHPTPPFRARFPLCSPPPLDPSESTILQEREKRDHDRSTTTPTLSLVPLHLGSFASYPPP